MPMYRKKLPSAWQKTKTILDTRLVWVWFTVENIAEIASHLRNNFHSLSLTLSFSLTLTLSFCIKHSCSLRVMNASDRGCSKCKNNKRRYRVHKRTHSVRETEVDTRFWFSGGRAPLCVIISRNVLLDSAARIAAGAFITPTEWPPVTRQFSTFVYRSHPRRVPDYSYDLCQCTTRTVKTTTNLYPLLCFRYILLLRVFRFLT